MHKHVMMLAGLKPLSTLCFMQEATESAENIRQDIQEMKNRFNNDQLTN